LPWWAGPSASTYSISAPSDTASEAGSVHGVVVQIGTATSASAGSVAPKRAASCCESRDTYATSIAGEVLSWYSISASASAEPQSKHQCTGLAPRTM